jgi:hypothetical protein
MAAVDKCVVTAGPADTGPDQPDTSVAVPDKPVVAEAGNRAVRPRAADLAVAAVELEYLRSDQLAATVHSSSCSFRVSNERASPAA